MVGGETGAELTNHLASGAVVVYALEWAKGVPWLRWIDANSKRVNAAVSFLAAGVIALGITATGDAGHGWTITVPPAGVLAVGLWDWAKQFLCQQVLYDGVVQRSGRLSQPRRP